MKLNAGKGLAKWDCTGYSVFRKNEWFHFQKMNKTWSIGESFKGCG
jgi:hypothetical protein